MSKVLLLNGDSTQALPLSRFLKKKGYNVDIVEYTKWGYGSASRYVSNRFLFLEHEDVEKYHEFLLPILKMGNYDTVIPCDDYGAMLLSKYRDEFLKFTQYKMPSFDVFEKGYDKHKLMELCQQKGYPHPQTVLVENGSLENLDLSALPYPLLIKPNHTCGARGMTYVRNSEELEQKFPLIYKEYGDCHLQQFIPAGGHQIEIQLYIGDNDELVQATVIKKYRWYPENGGSSCCNVSALNPEIVDVCYRLLKDIGWRGFADFDTIEDPRTGELLIMELNPRVPACVKSDMSKILLLDGEGVQVVCMARELNKLGHELTALCAQKISSGYATKYLHHKYKSPNVHLEAEAFKTYFYEHLKQHKYDLIIPMGDESAYFLSREKEKVEQQYKIICAVETYSTFELANDKQKLMEVCEKYDIVHPHTRALPSIKLKEEGSEFKENLKSVAEYVGFPAMIKPNLSAGAKGITKVGSLEELEEKYPPIAKSFGACALQQFVEQPDYYYNVMLFRRHDGKTAASTVIKIRRFFPLKGGTSCYSETVEHPFLIEQCERCLDKLNWHGFADFDILEDKRTRELKIIEINPRVPSSLQASFAAGVNFAKIFVDECLGNGAEVFDMKKYKSGQQVRWFGLDVMWFLMSPQRFSFKPSWFKFWGKNISYHDGTWCDPMPMIAGSLQGVVKYLDPNFRKAKLKG